MTNSPWYHRIWMWLTSPNVDSQDTIEGRQKMLDLLKRKLKSEEISISAMEKAIDEFELFYIKKQMERESFEYNLEQVQREIEENPPEDYTPERIEKTKTYVFVTMELEKQKIKLNLKEYKERLNNLKNQLDDMKRSFNSTTSQIDTLEEQIEFNISRGARRVHIPGYQVGQLDEIDEMNEELEQLNLIDQPVEDSNRIEGVTTMNEEELIRAKEAMSV
mmetsp:Transcript_10351/g.15136  ORF Transcript_10351/g.15136 Transcript_10351/m.15136 type:complete len:219 (+) Transcript_10351:267-923(+)|eukprot:CAMPEP_0117428930 /NCGR_PEP_ID=MMETSP0758-20121206/8532_1 /TAXON_ID=63605 /ORGANISM="Percolomonas cosmopolitus, Strain AE-1 (ATCC 50343)" /LENGTH=218 /DNA_ID=CAMNT_0005215567 /DNA_START=218 /DNA_END=874 /DNA_ORIENTATION=-